MSKLTPFGREIRKLRLDKDITLSEMANKIGKSPSFVSEVEVGRKPIPKGYVEKIIETYSLAHEEKNILLNAQALTMKHIPTDHLNLEQKEIVAAFARVIHQFSEQELTKVQKILAGHK
ncbi:helix-turn-helix domain-containing protein [Commensalibacter oyaizuii]|uniref:Helix-turn-helix domain-containing protein n=1 Tax=Commensalibacter oyaizuii TaxID=3043873 RepID=A0ABT6Q3W1_9PROT|nr:helix-turn-helix domain-containing protein [Commensalibacter sp. TBRC 16381]MDI2091705.1 helix-turn-helix domain-containing protein [Commensalibacter sp. TBRC 16381]